MIMIMQMPKHLASNQVFMWQTACVNQGLMKPLNPYPTFVTQLPWARLHGGDGDGVKDVGDCAAARQVIHRPRQALQHWPDRDRARALLHRLRTSWL